MNKSTSFSTFKLILIAVLLYVAFPFHAKAENFVEVNLPQSVKIQIPKNWIVLSNNTRTTLDSSVEARFNKSETPKTALPFAANLYNDNRETIGMVNARYYPELEVTQTEVEALSTDDIVLVDTALKEEMISAMKAAKMNIVSWQGTKRSNINGIVVLITEYHRESLLGEGNFRVRLVRVLAGSQSFTLTVSYLDSKANSALLEPITDHIITSLKM